MDQAAQGSGIPPDPQPIQAGGIVAEPQSSPAYSPVYSEYAKMFGVARESWLWMDRRSGLTPIAPGAHLGAESQAETYWMNDFRTRWQKIHLTGLSSWQLTQVGGIERAGILPSNLDEISPTFALERWANNPPTSVEPFYPLPKGYEGTWNADNPVVWNILKPILALATKIIEHAELFDWWDALISGERKPIDPSRIKPRDLLKASTIFSFHRRNRDEHRSAEAIARQRDVFAKVTASITYGFFHRSTGPVGDAFTQMPGWDAHAYTGWLADTKSSKITLSYNDLVPLLNRNLAESQRLIVQLFVCTTLVHEFAHAVENELRFQNWVTHIEPYFEDEAVAELGSSMQVDCFAGDMLLATRQVRLWPDRDFAGGLTLMLKEWLTPATTSDAPVLDEITYPALIQHFPINVDWISDIQQKDYWVEYASKFGANAMRPPRTMRATERYSSKDDEPSFSTGLASPDPSIPAEPSSYDKRRQITSANIIARIRGDRILSDEYRRLIQEQYPASKPLTMDGGLFHGAMDDWARAHLPRWRAVYADIHQFVSDHRGILAIDSMTAWTPFNLFLSYVNDQAVALQRPRWAAEDFLAYIRLHPDHYQFHNLGNGIVRIKAAGWPPIPAPPPPAWPPLDTPMGARIQMLSRWLDDWRMSIWQHYDTRRRVNSWWKGLNCRDCDQLRVFDGFNAHIMASDDGGLMWTYQQLDDAIRLLGRLGHKVCPGPPGVMRRLPQGWEEPWLCDLKAKPGGSSDSDASSDSSDPPELLDDDDDSSSDSSDSSGSPAQTPLHITNPDVPPVAATVQKRVRAARRNARLSARRHEAMSKTCRNRIRAR